MGNRFARSFIITFGFILGIVAGLIVYLVTARLSSSYAVSAPAEFMTAQPGPGAPCGNHYDEKGLRRDQLLDPIYSGPGPLYYVEIDALPTPPAAGGCEMPASISSEIAVGGEPRYPLLVDAGTAAEWVRTGETFQLSLSLTLASTFPGHRNYYLAGDISSVAIVLSAPNFDFSPPNEEAPPLNIQMDRTVQRQWLLAPKERALGNQLILASLYSDPNDFLTAVAVNLEVRSVLGVDPLVAALIGGLATALAWLVGIAAAAAGVWEKLGKRKAPPANQAPGSSGADAPPSSNDPPGDRPPG
jgi:hypothetical protein